VLRVQAPSQGPAQDADQDPDQETGAANVPSECLIPFVSLYVDRVDLAGRCVHVDWQPGD
jgi:16S rRNA processing protein RimM